MPKITPAPERFWPKVQKTETCWLWTASLDAYGYGQFSARTGKMVKAHRFAYEAMCGPIPNGRQIDHLCRVRHCVNPEHLEPVTSRENTRRGESPAGLNTRRTRCPQGHEYTHQNTIVRADGRRHCRACHNHTTSRPNRRHVA